MTIEKGAKELAAMHRALEALNAAIARVNRLQAEQGYWTNMDEWLQATADMTRKGEAFGAACAAYAKAMK